MGIWASVQLTMKRRKLTRMMIDASEENDLHLKGLRKTSRKMNGALGYFFS